MSAEEGILAIKPNNISHQDAATICFGATTALFFLKKANTKSGQKILVYGASGAVGTAAVQLAKYFGAEVTGVCSTSNLELMKSLGADKVIDYTKENFAENGEMYDVVFETVDKILFSDLLQGFLSSTLKIIRALSSEKEAIYLCLAWMINMFVA